MKKVFDVLLRYALVLLLGTVVGCGSEPTPDDGSEDFEKAEAAYDEHDLKAAAAAYADAARKCPTNFQARLSLALIACELGDVSAAVAASEEALALDATSAEALLAAGQAAFMSRDMPLSKMRFKQVANARDVAPALRAQAFVSRAVVEITESDPVSARLSLWRALRQDRRCAAAWYHLGYLSRNVFHYDAAALEQYQMAAALMDSRDARTQEVVRKIIPALRESITAAVSRRPGAASRKPEEAARLLTESEAAIRKRFLKVAREKLEKAYALDPLSYPIARALADLLARSSSVKGGAERVLGVYQSAIENAPSSSETYVVASQFALRNARPQWAAEFLSRALAHNPNSKKIFDLYLEALRKSGRTRIYQACQEYRREM